MSSQHCSISFASPNRMSLIYGQSAFPIWSICNRCLEKTKSCCFQQYILSGDPDMVPVSLRALSSSFAAETLVWTAGRSEWSQIRLSVLTWQWRRGQTYCEGAYQVLINENHTIIIQCFVESSDILGSMIYQPVFCYFELIGWWSNWQNSRILK